MIDYNITSNYNNTDNPLITNGGGVITTPIVFNISTESKGRNKSLNYIQVSVVDTEKNGVLYHYTEPPFNGQTINNEDWVLVNLAATPGFFVVNYWGNRLQNFKSSSFLINYHYTNVPQEAGEEDIIFKLEWEDAEGVHEKLYTIKHIYS